LADSRLWTISWGPNVSYKVSILSVVVWYRHVVKKAGTSQQRCKQKSCNIVRGGLGVWIEGEERREQNWIRQGFIAVVMLVLHSERILFVHRWIRLYRWLPFTIRVLLNWPMRGSQLDWEIDSVHLLSLILDSCPVQLCLFNLHKNKLNIIYTMYVCFMLLWETWKLLFS